MRAIELEKFIWRGNMLRNETQELSDNLIETVKQEIGAFPKLFYFVEASSGMGKSQLAQSLALPVVYIPLSLSQPVYECFSDVSDMVKSALKDDLVMLDKKYSNKIETIRSANLKTTNIEFDTVGLMMSLFKMVYGKSNEESMRILSGANGQKEVNYSPMTFSDAKKEMQELLGRKDTNLLPVFFIDEAPSNEDDYQYSRCILLRNIIRIIGGACLLSGTEAAAINTIDNFPESSRSGYDVEYMRLILKLPPTHWPIFATDPTYSALIASLSDDVREMLQKTRPLFVYYVLGAMLAESTNTLTPSVLSKAKTLILERKKSFYSDGGLFAQIALMHAKSIAKPVSDQLTNGVNFNYNNTYKKYCVRHHFGEMRIGEKLQSTDLTLSLFDPGDLKDPLQIKIEDKMKPFRPNVVFCSADEDPLLYLICLRNGLFLKDEGAKSCSRISTSFGHVAIQQPLTTNSPRMNNVNQDKCDGTFLETEIVSAAIAATHSYASGLDGCPLSFFLRSMVAELNPNVEYVPYDQFELIRMPQHYDDITIGLLSPANDEWLSNRSNNRAVTGNHQVQHESIVLSNFVWSANKDKNDGAFPMTYREKVYNGSMEAKCYKDRVPTKQLTATILNNKKNNHLVTFMVVTDISNTTTDNKKFNEAKKSSNVVKIIGNANKQNPVASVLNWTVLHESNSNSPNNTVIVISLETIFHERYARMSSIYKS
jgi:hypothetical protein